MNDFRPEMRGHTIQQQAILTEDGGGAGEFCNARLSYVQFLRVVGVLGTEPEAEYRVSAAQGFAAWRESSHNGQPGADAEGGEGMAYMRWLALCNALGARRLALLQGLTDVQADASVPTAPESTAEAERTLRAARKIGNAELTAHMEREIVRLNELRKMRESIIEAHRLSAMLQQAAIWDALDAAAEKMQEIMKDKSYCVARKGYCDAGPEKA